MKKLLSFVLTSLLLITCLTINIKTLRADGETYTVDFGSGSWTIGEVTVTVDKNGIINNIEKNSEITLTNFNSETMEVKVGASDGFNVMLNVVEGKTSLAARSNDGGYPSGTLTFVVQPKNQSGPGPQQELDVNGYPIVTDGNLKIFTEQNGFIGELKINDAGVVSNQDRTKFATKIENTSSFSVQIQLEFGKAVSSITLNDTSFSGETLTPISGTNDCYLFNNISVNENGMLQISFVETESTISTIIWTYDENDPNGQNGDTYGEDTLVQHGKVEIVSIKRGEYMLYENNSYTSNVEMESGRPKDSAKIGVDVEDVRGYVRLEKGDDIVIKLIPEYGYQLKTATINDSVLTPISDNFSNVSTFKLDNVQGQMHFSGIFEKTENTYNINSNVIGLSNLEVSDNSNTVSSGTLKVSVNNASDFDASTVNGIDGYVSNNIIDVSIDNIVSQGSENNYWSNNIAEFKDVVDVSLNINDFDPNYDYKVVRQHGSDVSLVDSTIDENGVLTFESDKFSSYKILKKHKLLGGGNNSNSSYKAPNTSVR